LRFDLRFRVKDLGIDFIRLELGLRFEVCDLNLSYQRLEFGTWDLIRDLPITAFLAVLESC